ncbi:MAG: MaoC family dehydratase N-terminal domain-containing protein [Chloroflexi bacterium]|nr:MaoC family dehydratase N-terminal domain-containing protein [Chloroflexota bacterium]
MLDIIINDKRWEWEAVEIGTKGDELTLDVTSESVATYAKDARNFDHAYIDAGSGDLAMPTGIFRDCQLRRHSVAQAAGYTSLEMVEDNPRQTPFAKCTARWFAPIRVGDTLTSSAQVLEKYERRGSKFVTFRVEITNQDQERVAEYDYTCIFEYAKGQNLS